MRPAALPEPQAHHGERFRWLTLLLPGGLVDDFGRVLAAFNETFALQLRAPSPPTLKVP